MTDLIYWRVTKAFAEYGHDFPSTLHEGTREQLEKVIEAFGYDRRDDTLWIKTCPNNNRWYIGLSFKAAYDEYVDMNRKAA
jgi:hypothetical protein